MSMGRRRLPPLNALKAFEAAARCTGFTAAAQELCVSAGAISRHVANLEEYFGVPMFHRRHNEISLTAEGEEFFGRISSALDVIEDASQRLLQGANSRQLHVSVLPTFALHWLIPRLSRFSAMYPNADIQIASNLTQIGQIDLEEDRVDIAVHFGLSDVSGQYCDLLFETELQAVCSPAVFAGPSPIRVPHDMAKQVLLHTSNALSHWRQWFRAAGVGESAAETGLKFGNSALALQAAIDGVGVACIETVYVRDELAAGRLVSPFDLRVYTGNMYFMSVHPRRAHVPIVRAFRDWLLSEISHSSSVAATPLQDDNSHLLPGGQNAPSKVNDQTGSLHEESFETGLSG